MTTTDYNDVLDSVDLLTLPQHTREPQAVNKHGDPARSQAEIFAWTTVTIEHPPLLQQLADAIAGAVGAGQSKGTVAFERNPLDTDALYRFMKIDETIRQWCTEQGIKWGTDPVRNLRAWYAATLAGNHDKTWDDFYVTQMRKWVAEIRAKLDPPRQKDLPDSCPVCGADAWWRDGNQYRRPLVIYYRPQGANTMQHARALCRACEYAWDGDYGIRTLAWALEHPDTETIEAAEA